MNNEKLLSVIVTYAGGSVELKEAFHSLLETSFPQQNFEVLLVDDGSDEVVSTIVQEYEPRFANLKRVSVAPAALISEYRTVGLARATGKYVVFMDSRDQTPAKGFTNLVQTAIDHEADIVVGYVNQFDADGNKDAFPDQLGVSDNRFETSLVETTDLVYDTLINNKLYRREFLADSSIQFTDNSVDTDMSFTLAAHLASKSTSIITNQVYLWRAREIHDYNGPERNEFSDFEARTAKLNVCRTILTDNGIAEDSAVYATFIHKVVSLDLPSFFTDVADTSEAFQYRIQELVYGFLRDWKLWQSEALKQVDLKTQLQYWAIEHGNLNLLKQYSYAKKIYQIKERWGRGYQLSIPGTDQAIVEQLSPYDNVLPVGQQLSSLKLDKETNLLTGSGYFRIKNMPLTKKPFSNDNFSEVISAELVNIVNHAVYPIDFKRSATPVNKRIFKSHSPWTHARYAFTIDMVEAAKQLGQGIWKIKVTNEVAGRYKAEEFIQQPSRKAKKFKLKLVQNNNVVTARFNTQSTLSFVCATQEARSNLWLKEAQESDNQLVLATNLNPENERAIIHLGSDELAPIVGQIKAGKVSFDLSSVPIDLLGAPLKLMVQNLTTNFDRTYLYEYQKPADVFNIGKRMINVNYASTKRLLISVDYPAVTVTNDKFSGNQLVEKLQLLKPVSDYDLAKSRLVLISNSRKRRNVFKLTDIVTKETKDSVLAVSLPLLHEDGRLAILSGNYRYTLEVFDKAEQEIHTFSVVDGKYRDPAKAINNPKLNNSVALTNKNVAQLTLASAKNNAHELRVKQPYSGWFNVKKGRRAVSYTLLYPLMRLLPLKKNVMVFDAHSGAEYSGNTKAIFEYVAEHHPEIKPVWLFTNDQEAAPLSAEVVRTNTVKYWYYLAVGKYFVQGVNFTNQYYKRKGQIEVETLRGTFLREMGFDAPKFRTASAKVQLDFADRIRRWDYLVVPSDYMELVATKAFDYDRNVLKTGFPKNDELVRANRDPHRKDVLKAQLGLPLDKKVILYNPVKRGAKNSNFELDLERLRAGVGDDYIVLLYLDNYLAYSTDFNRYEGFAYDVSDYPEINDLFLVSDVLLTDYNNSMFDYAYLQRPMIFFAYDEEEFLKDSPRQTYFDYDSQMPGPIVSDTDSVVTAIQNLAMVKSQYAGQLSEFADRFAQYGRDGEAAKAVVDTMLNANAKELDQEPPTAVIWDKFWHFFKIKDFQSNLLNYLGRVLPKKNIIIFESFFGRQFSDNPKALYEYIKQNYPEYKLYWNVREDLVPYFKEHKIPYAVRFGYKGLLKQAQAKYFITNTRRPFRWDKPQGTTLLQTWHGTPLKTIGTDVQLVTMPVHDPGKYHQQVVRDSSRWDYLIAPNKYSADIMSRAFRKDTNQMMLTGYPRNDILVNYTPEDIARIKGDLGLDPNKKLVLYAPTWRDDEFVKAHEFTAQLRLDLAELQARFGSDVTFLIRTHYMIANSLDLTQFTNAVNVSDYQDISELYLISDVLITDYSSVMFDYSILRRPIIFYTYDLEQYAGTIRGFYFDFTEAAPGKLVKTTTEVGDELADIFTNGWQPDQQYIDFTERFDEWMDGKASERVVNELFARDNMKTVPVKGDLSSLGIGEQQIELRDAAAIWASNKDFTSNEDVSFVQYYDKLDKPLPVEALEGQLIKSTHTDVLMQTYIKVKVMTPNRDIIGWVSRDDVM